VSGSALTEREQDCGGISTGATSSAETLVWRAIIIIFLFFYDFIRLFYTSSWRWA
jgi:hypothetical protein